MHLVYVDDSRQRDKNRSGFQVVSAVILKDDSFKWLEQHFGYTFETLLEPYLAAPFEEFHAADLLAANPPFEKIDRQAALKVLKAAISVIGDLNITVVYGVVDVTKLNMTVYGSVDPVSIAFSACLKLVEEWFTYRAPDSLGLLISDNTADRIIKTSMLEAFYSFRNRVRSSPAVRGELEHLHDDMYFGDSKYSTGIQLADICALIISRHWVNYADTADMYQSLTANIFKSAIKP